LVSPVYITVMLCVPAEVNCVVRVALALAFVGEPELRPEALLGVTVTVPRVVDPDINLADPVGPTPLLWVAMLAVKVTL
jgi:hypothetical protein